MSESVILCEGYHDRAFWAGWLQYLGCINLRQPSGATEPVRVKDPWGKAVTGGQFGYDSRGHRFIRISPCGDRREVLREARNRLDQERQRHQQGASEVRLARLVLNIDPDVNANGTSMKTGFRRQDLRTMVQEYDPSVAENEQGDFALFDARVLVSLVRWEAPDAILNGIPNQQTLERVVCAALIAAYPARGPAVHQWLQSRPNPPPKNPKESAWSYMAGWYAKFGCEAFYQQLWADTRVAAELKSRLIECDA